MVPPPDVFPHLTKITHGSAPFIATFLLIHLSAPVLANLGGSSLASQTMLLGREYYQTPFAEKWLVLAPLIVHPLSGAARRLLSPPNRPPPRRLSSLLSCTAYAALFVFLPIHFITHRVNPMDVAAPVFAVGPSELDYEYVKLGLQTWPWRSWALYVGLVGCVALHAAEGMHVIATTRFKDALRWWKGSSRNYRIGFAIGGLVLPVLSGVFVLSREPLMALASLSQRFEASFKRLFLYRM